MMDTTEEIIEDEEGCYPEKKMVDLTEQLGCEVEVEIRSGPLAEDKMEVGAKTRHILQLIAQAREENCGEHMISLVHLAVYQQLKNLGVELELPATRGRSKARKSNGGKGSRMENGSHRLVDAQLTNWDVTVKVPILIKETCEFLRQHVDTEGIFRKSGSSSRIHTLMQRFALLEKHEEFSFSSSDTVFDVATVLKQYLRELDTPLIPYEMHGLIRKCLDISDEVGRVEAIMLCTCLLSEFSISILSYLVEFLNEVVSNKDSNKMSHENLAIVIGPNVMPVEVRKNDKAKELEHERKFIDAHTKIFETMIKNTEKLGCLPVEVEKKVEYDYSTRGSEDELENEGGSRRKKRRSGSLTRVLGFLRKVGKSTDTPAQTPNYSDFTHTPVMKSNKRRCLDENIFSLQKKRTILDGIRKNGLTVKDEDKRFSHISDTPNSLAGFITCPSPVCLNPSPMKVDWKQTPNNAGRFKNLVTPSLLRRKDKDKLHDPSKSHTPFSAPAKPVKARLGLGKKSAKKQVAVAIVAPVPVALAETNGLARSVETKRLPANMSIRKLATSPRKVIRASSTRIPRPDKVNPVRKSISSVRVTTTVSSPRNSKPKLLDRNVSSISGEYVKLSPSAHLNDIRNDAFIASKISCLEDSVDLATGQENEGQVEGTASLRLTPLIQEIHTLTLSAQEELTLSGLLKKKSSSKIAEGKKNSSPAQQKPPPVPCRSTRRRSSGAGTNKARLQSPPEPLRTRTNSNSLGERRNAQGKAANAVARSNSIKKVEEKFTRALNETKIMRIQSERTARANQRAVNIHRRFSVQDKGLSPAQRRIASNAARRKSNEMNRPIANVAATGMSTPMNDLARCNVNSTGGFLSRSPNRCTLKRGRPNTLRSGLARPSPATSRNNSTLGPSSIKKNDDNIDSKENTSKKSLERNEKPEQVVDLQADNLYMPTPMRRMSSVQELVKLMEKAPIDTNPRVLNEQNHLQVPQTEPPPPKRTMTRSGSSSKFLKPTPVAPAKQPRSAKVIDMSTPKLKPAVLDRTKRDSSEMAWTPASDFNFDSHRKRLLRGLGEHHEDRDSIQALKTLNAGKVSQNVRLFDGMSRTRKSPGKSLIPRYVALHRQESFTSKNRLSLGAK